MAMRMLEMGNKLEICWRLGLPLMDLGNAFLLLKFLL